MAHRLDRDWRPTVTEGSQAPNVAMLRRDGRVALKRMRGLK